MPPLPRRRRRLGRIVLNALTGVSLLLCVGTIWSWIETRDQERHVEVRFRYHRAEIAVSGGHAQIGWTTFREPEQSRFAIGRGNFVKDFLWIEQSRKLVLWEGGGIARSSWRSPSLYIERLIVPLWLVLMLALLIPGFRATAIIVLRRLPMPGLCPHCRYDLTGNVSGTCPECGTPVAAITAKGAAAAEAAVAPPAGPAPKPDA